jgi:hypothetical protein
MTHDAVSQVIDRSLRHGYEIYSEYLVEVVNPERADEVEIHIVDSLLAWKGN